MSESMFDLKITRLENGGLELEQAAGALDPADVQRIHLHPLQARLVGEHAGLPNRLLGHLRSLSGHLRELDLYMDEIWDHCASSPEISLHLRAIDDLVDELATDAGVPRHENSEEISVTPPAPEADKKRPGRPKKPDALSNAERQQRYRERHGEQPSLSLTEAST